MALSIEITLTYNAFKEAYELWDMAGFTDALRKYEGLQYITYNHTPRSIKIENLNRCLKKSKEYYSFHVENPARAKNELVYISYLNPSDSNIGKLDIHKFDNLIKNRESWLKNIYSHESFIQCRVYNTEYSRIQNMSDIQSYELYDLKHDHLPKVNNGMPYPLNMDQIDTSCNPGYWTFRNGYLESVGSEMWLGKHFFNRVNLSVDDLKRVNWLKLTELDNGVIYIKSNEFPFDSSEGEQRYIQEKLRNLLYSNANLFNKESRGDLDIDYGILIERKDRKITFSEWIETICKIQNIKFDGNPQILKNRATGEVITIGGNPNIVAVNFSDKQSKEEWRTCIYFKNGSVMLNIINDIENIDKRLKLTISKIAKELGANIVGYDGEVYDW
ncbi:hypothetical protein K2227_02910 [Shewanella putrefaciens]|nr:hypothetical protein K2227_02910 [Shewanella putrefaciens]